MPKRLAKTAVRVSMLILAALLFNLPILPPGALFSLQTRAEAASMNLGGRRLTCSRGKVIVDNSMGAIGLASPSAKKIWLNMRRLNRYPRSFRHFVFLHECAHMYIRNETQADCWAIGRGVYRGLFNRASIKQICTALWRTPAGFYHLAGPDRCSEMNKCYNAVTAKRPKRVVRRIKRRRKRRK